MEEQKQTTTTQGVTRRHPLHPRAAQPVPKHTWIVAPGPSRTAGAKRGWCRMNVYLTLAPTLLAVLGTETAFLVIRLRARRCCVGGVCVEWCVRWWCVRWVVCVSFREGIARCAVFVRRRAAAEQEGRVRWTSAVDGWPLHNAACACQKLPQVHKHLGDVEEVVVGHTEL